MTLAGEVEVTTSDGETRCFGPGSIYFLDDVTGKGHFSRVIGGKDWFGVGVDLVQRQHEREESKTIVARFMEEVINQRHFDVLDDDGCVCPTTPHGVKSVTTPRFASRHAV